MVAKHLPAVIAPGIDESSPAAFKEFRPDTYEAILTSLADGGAVSAVASAVGVRRGLIYEIARTEGHTIEEKKDALAKKFRAIASKAATVTYEGLDDCSSRDAAVIAGISVDKFMALEGDPGQIVEVRHKVESIPLASVLKSTGHVIEAIEPEECIIEADFTTVGQG